MVLIFYKPHKFSAAGRVARAVQESTTPPSLSPFRGIGHCAGFYERASKQIGARPTVNWDCPQDGEVAGLRLRHVLINGLFGT